MTTISNAVGLLKGSKRFHTLLELLLALGNYINGNTARGAGYGFRIDSLHQVKDMRGNGSRTLLSYLVTVLERDHQDLLKLSSEFEPVREAQRGTRPYCCVMDCLRSF